MVTPDDLLEQTQWDTFWVPPDVRVTDRPELLYLSCAREVTTLNCVMRAIGRGETLRRLVDEVVAAHAGRTSRWPVRDGRPELEQALSPAGYRPRHRHFACTMPTDRFQARSSAAFVVRQVATMDDLRDWVRVVDLGFNRSAPTTEEELVSGLRQCSGPDARVFRFVACERAGGRPVSAAGMTWFPALGFCFLWAGCTVPDARGRGAYSAVLAARMRKAKELGAQRAGLYALVDTSAPVVARQGFERHAPMTYWERPSDAR